MREWKGGEDRVRGEGKARRGVTETNALGEKEGEDRKGKEGALLIIVCHLIHVVFYGSCPLIYLPPIPPSQNGQRI